MDLKKYVEFCRSVAIYPDANTGSAEELMYLTLGLCGEVAELGAIVYCHYKEIDSDTFNHKYDEIYIDEIGDILWYTFRIIDWLHDDYLLKVASRYIFDDYYSSFSASRDLYIRAMSRFSGKLCNDVKKIYRDGDSDYLRKRINSDLSGIIKNISSLIKDSENVFERNMGKLSIRKEHGLFNIFERNMEKLSSRKERGVLGGSGDNR